MSRSLPRRMLRAARLESALYEEVEAEPRSLGQAVVVVLLAIQTYYQRRSSGAILAWLRALGAPRAKARLGYDPKRGVGLMPRGEEDGDG